MRIKSVNYLINLLFFLILMVFLLTTNVFAEDNNYLIQIGDQIYTSIQDAINNVGDDETISIIKMNQHQM